MGEVLHEVDFQQLKIENSQYLEKIDERNQDLLRLKLMAGNVLQVLNAYKVGVTGPGRLKGALHPTALFLKTLCIFSKKKK